MKRAILHYALKAAATLAAGLIVMLGAQWALGALYAQLVDVWGVTLENAASAPTWVQALYFGGGSVIGAISQGLMWPLAWLALRVFEKKPLAFGRGALLGAVGGLLLGAALFGILLAIDALRISGVSAFSPLVIAPVAMYIMAALGGEALFRGALMGVGENAPFALKMAVSALTFALMTASFEPLPLACALLTGALMCLIYRRSGGFGAGALLRMALTTFLYGFAGCPGGAAFSPVATHVSQLTYLSGGANGPTNGLLYLAFVALMIAAFALDYARATHSISTSAPSGSADTSTHERAGKPPSK